MCPEGGRSARRSAHDPPAHRPTSAAQRTRSNCCPLGATACRGPDRGQLPAANSVSAQALTGPPDGGLPGAKLAPKESLIRPVIEWAHSARLTRTWRGNCRSINPRSPQGSATKLQTNNSVRSSILSRRPMGIGSDTIRVAATLRTHGNGAEVAKPTRPCSIRSQQT